MTTRNLDGTDFPPIEPGASLILAWQVRGKRVLIIGGGAVAAGRLSALLAADAIVTLISPLDRLSPEVHQRIFVDKLVPTYHDRNFLGVEDVEGYEMVLTAIDSPGLSSEICKMCRERRIAVNVADIPPECDFYFGSIVRRGPLQIMVSTNGKGPRIANRIRRQIERGLPDNVGEAIEVVGKLRGELRKIAPGKDVATIDRRMEWMIRVCDKWSMEELGNMDEEMRNKILDGWEDGVAKSYWNVKRGVGARFMSVLGLGRCPVAENPDGRVTRCPFVLTTSGFLMGAVTVGAVVAARWHFVTSR
ncbi:precorrin-2 dehydrogenase / sirohydrochlorin ferrochelatase, partial [Phenoliferia sp. Uapishka_3]